MIHDHAIGDAVVFVGPSLPLEQARAACDAHYRPPARRGDIEQAERDGARTIVLIDGYLIHDYPPSPMEIAGVLRRGVRVLGAASLGALRAVELRDYGMLGTGWVHRHFATGQVDGDDEVVVACDSRDGSAITVSLINIRYAIQQVYWRGLISFAQAGEVFERIAGIYLEDRTADAVRAALAPALAGSLVEELLSPRYNIKARDAMNVLLRIVVERMSAAPPES